MPEKYAYPATFEKQAGGALLVRFPDLPDAITFGQDEADALEAAADCLREALRARVRDDEDIPIPSATAGTHSISVPAEVAAKLEIYAAFRRAGLTRVALADRLHVQENEVRRILDLNHRTKLNRLDQAAIALGGRLRVDFAVSGDSARPHDHPRPR